MAEMQKVMAPTQYGPQRVPGQMSSTPIPLSPEALADEDKRRRAMKRYPLSGAIIGSEDVGALLGGDR